MFEPLTDHQRRDIRFDNVPGGYNGFRQVMRVFECSALAPSDDTRFVDGLDEQDAAGFPKSCGRSKGLRKGQRYFPEGNAFNLDWGIQFVSLTSRAPLKSDFQPFSAFYNMVILNRILRGVYR